MRLVVAIYGPTSSGKTALSVRLCELIGQRLGVAPVVISADSRQVYRFMDIGTSKTTVAEMGSIPHRMIDVTEPVRKYELEEYVAAAREHLQRCLDEGGLPVIVGGTGTYLRALLEGWEVDRVGRLRTSLRKDFPRGMAADAHATLARLDPGAAARVHANNHDGVINALARVMAGDDETGAPQAKRLLLGLDPPSADLGRRVAETVARQLSAGLHDEVVQLDSRYELHDQFRRLRDQAPNQVLHTHGYTEWFEVARDHGRRVHELSGTDLDEVRRRAVDRITAHARRQRSVLAKLEDVHRVTTPEQALRLVEAQVRRPEPAPRSPTRTRGKRDASKRGRPRR